MSVRAIYRDIASLRAGGARIDGAAGYGYVLAEDPALPPQSFTRIEIEALLLGLAEAQNSGDPGIAQAAEVVVAKIIATLPERQQREAAHSVQYVHKTTRRDVPGRDLGLIRSACWDEQVLELTYRDEADNETRRKVWPLMPGYGSDRIKILAWCLLRQDWRQFRIDRIVAATLTGDSFRPRRVGLINGYIAQLRGAGPDGDGLRDGAAR